MNRNAWLLIVGILALAALGGGAVLMNTRGFRNNNPGNLRGAIPWKGRIGLDPDGFAIFETMELGVRALRVDLTAKMNRGLNTVRKILMVYAPPHENPTASYIRKVSEWMGVNADQPLTVTHLPGLVSGIIRFEQGGPLQAAVINAGLMLA
jgi:hypothetical protein